MKSEIIKLENVTCKGFVKTLTTMLSKVEGINNLKIDHIDSEVILEMETKISRDELYKKLIDANHSKSGKSCGNCVVEKLKTM